MVGLICITCFRLTSCFTSNLRYCVLSRGNQGFLSGWGGVDWSCFRFSTPKLPTPLPVPSFGRGDFVLDFLTLAEFSSSIGQEFLLGGVPDEDALLLDVCVGGGVNFGGKHCHRQRELFHILPDSPGKLTFLSFENIQNGLKNIRNNTGNGMISSFHCYRSKLMFFLGGVKSSILFIRRPACFPAWLRDFSRQNHFVPGHLAQNRLFSRDVTSGTLRPY